MKKLLPFLVVIAVAAAAVAVVLTNKNDNNKNTNTTPPAATSQNDQNTTQGTNNTAPSPQSSQENKVSIVSMNFSPASLSVKKGSSVTWTNDDSVAHTVTADTGTDHGLNSGNINPGETYVFTFSDKGTFAYHCELHPSMTGTVTVRE
jgi:plastocyanin